jgi:hypothetical protein
VFKTLDNCFLKDYIYTETGEPEVPWCSLTCLFERLQVKELGEVEIPKGRKSLNNNFRALKRRYIDYFRKLISRRIFRFVLK